MTPTLSGDDWRELKVLMLADDAVIAIARRMFEANVSVVKALAGFPPMFQAQACIIAAEMNRTPLVSHEVGHNAGLPHYAGSR